MAAARPLQPLSVTLRWAVLLAASLVLGGVLAWAKLPAALMLGPLAAALLAQMAGGAVTVPRALMVAAQAVIGCLDAKSITPAIITGLALHWPIFLGVVFAIMWLSGSLFADDLEAMRAEERRLARCPAHVR